MADGVVSMEALQIRSIADDARLRSCLCLTRPYRNDNLEAKDEA